jgi:hypothetical protein
MVVLFDLNDTLGASLIAVVVSSAYGYIPGILKRFNSPPCTRLFGVMCVQAFYYFQNYSSDNIFVKALVRVSPSTLNNLLNDPPIGDVLAVCSTNFIMAYNLPVLTQKNRILQALHSALATYGIYYYCILNYFNPISFLGSNWSISVCYYYFCLC